MYLYYRFFTIYFSNICFCFKTNPFVLKLPPLHRSNFISIPCLFLLVKTFFELFYLFFCSFFSLSFNRAFCLVRFLFYFHGILSFSPQPKALLSYHILTSLVNIFFLFTFHKFFTYYLPMLWLFCSYTFLYL